MADFKIGNITPLVGNLKAGSTDVIRVMNGSVQVWPPTVILCNEYTIGGYDQGCTTYINCEGIQEEACYNGPSAGGYDQTSFYATEIISFYGAEPALTGLCPH